MIPTPMMSTNQGMAGCPCATTMNNGGNAASGGGSTGGNSSTMNGSPGAGGIGIGVINMNANGGAYNDDTQTSNAETLLSSNAKFQAISAIAVAQDGVINVADQGKMDIVIFFSVFI